MWAIMVGRRIGLVHLPDHPTRYPGPPSGGRNQLRQSIVTARVWRFAPNVGKIAMAEPVQPDIVVYVCQNCIPEDGGMPLQWNQDGAHVLVRQIPCSGKIDAQYLFHALEAGCHGLCVVACSRGKCRLGEGNYRPAIH